MKRSKRDDARHQRQSEATLRIMQENRTLELPEAITLMLHAACLRSIRRDRVSRFTKKEGTPSDETT